MHLCTTSTGYKKTSCRATPENAFEMPMVIRSSVRPKSSKQQWGTILKPDEMSLGHKQVTTYEINQIVSRLYYVPLVSRSSTSPELQNTSLRGESAKSRRATSRVDIDHMVQRLSQARQIPPSADHDSKALRDLGVVNSYAWKGCGYLKDTYAAYRSSVSALPSRHQVSSALRWHRSSNTDLL